MSNGFRVRKYFKPVELDKNGEVVMGKNHYEFDSVKYQKYLALDGHCAIVIKTNLEGRP